MSEKMPVMSEKMPVMSEIMSEKRRIKNVM